MAEGINLPVLYDEALRLLGDQGKVEVTTDPGVTIAIEKVVDEGREALRIVAQGNAPVLMTRNSDPTQNGVTYGLGYVRDWIHDVASVVAKRESSVDWGEL